MKALDINSHECYHNIMVIEQYIEQRIVEYREPSKQGKRLSQGEKVGYGRSKFSASLYLALTDRSILSLAELVATKYEVLRRWNIETEFKVAMEQRRAEFATYYIDRLLTAIKNLEEGDLSTFQEIAILLREAEGFRPEVLESVKREYQLLRDKGRKLPASEFDSYEIKKYVESVSCRQLDAYMKEQGFPADARGEIMRIFGIVIEST